MSPNEPSDREPKVSEARACVAATDFSDPAQAKAAAEALVEALEAVDDLVAQLYRLG